MNKMQMQLIIFGLILACNVCAQSDYYQDRSWWDKYYSINSGDEVRKFESVMKCDNSKCIEIGPQYVKFSTEGYLLFSTKNINSDIMTIQDRGLDFNMLDGFDGYQFDKSTGKINLTARLQNFRGYKERVQMSTHVSRKSIVVSLGSSNISYKYSEGKHVAGTSLKGNVESDRNDLVGCVFSFDSSYFDDGSQLNNDELKMTRALIEYNKKSIGLTINIPGYSQPLEYSAIKYDSSDSSYVMATLFHGRKNIVKIAPNKGTLIFRYPDNRPIFMAYSGCSVDPSKLDQLIQKGSENQMEDYSCSSNGASINGRADAREIIAIFSELQIIKTPKYAHVYGTGPGLMDGYQPYDGVLSSKQKGAYESTSGEGKFTLDFSTSKVSGYFYDDANNENNYVKIEYRCSNNKDILSRYTTFPTAMRKISEAENVASVGISSSTENPEKSEKSIPDSKTVIKKEDLEYIFGD